MLEYRYQQFQRMRNSAELISKQVMSEMLCDVVRLTEDPIGVRCNGM